MGGCAVDYIQILSFYIRDLSTFRFWYVEVGGGGTSYPQTLRDVCTSLHLPKATLRGKNSSRPYVLSHGRLMGVFKDSGEGKKVLLLLFPKFLCFPCTLPTQLFG